jgi:outer membrane protein OmpA-like peptidoglycan-associated protein
MSRAIEPILVCLLLTNLIWAKTEPTVLLNGVVLDAQTRKPLTAKLTFFDRRGNKVNETRSNAAEQGKYQCILKPREQYDVEFQTDGYMRWREAISTPDVSRPIELSRDFVLMPKVSGRRLLVSVPLFEHQSARFRVGIDERLSQYVQLLQLNPDIGFAIECYPDKPDTADKMATLSGQRADSIIAYFRRRGISPSRLEPLQITSTDPYNPPPRRLRPKGRFYYGGTYFTIRVK